VEDERDAVLVWALVDRGREGVIDQDWRVTARIDDRTQVDLGQCRIGGRLDHHESGLCGERAADAGSGRPVHRGAQQP
jgi:hypothetical protein